MTSERLRWEEISRQDPFWAVLSFPGQKYGRWDSERFFATGEREIAEVMSHAARLSRPVRRESALDFGCGLGRLTRALSRRFETAVGLDISETMVEQARKLNADFPGCAFRVNIWPDLRDVPDQSFDLVYSGRVLQHLPSRGEIERCLTEFLRVVRDDGLVAFQLPHKLSLPVRLKPRRNLYLLLRGLGFSSTFLYWRLGLHPMQVTSITTSEVAGFLTSRGARVLDVEQREGEMGCQESIYFIAPAGVDADASDRLSAAPAESDARTQPDQRENPAAFS
jgi:SAM-dependent methyltransferase